MGYLKSKHGMTLFGKKQKGICPECAMKHDPKQPHCLGSRDYQYRFYSQHGRWPTWEDAMAHCPQEVKDFWMRALRARGVEV